jgi:hypothetical protein
MIEFTKGLRNINDRRRDEKDLWSKQNVWCTASVHDNETNEKKWNLTIEISGFISSTVIGLDVVGQTINIKTLCTDIAGTTDTHIHRASHTRAYGNQRRKCISRAYKLDELSEGTNGVYHSVEKHIIFVRIAVPKFYVIQ